MPKCPATQGSRWSTDQRRSLVWKKDSTMMITAWYITTQWTGSQNEVWSVRRDMLWSQLRVGQEVSISSFCGLSRGWTSLTSVRLVVSWVGVGVKSHCSCLDLVMALNRKEREKAQVLTYTLGFRVKVSKLTAGFPSSTKSYAPLFALPFSWAFEVLVCIYWEVRVCFVVNEFCHQT